MNDPVNQPVPDATALNAWLGKLSHDLRNQLAPLRTASQMMLSGRLAPERQAEMLQMIDRQVLRLTRMLDDLSELGQLQAGTNPAKRERLDLGILIDTALGECGRRLLAAEIAYDYQAPEQRLPLQGDRQGLVRIFVRLLDNAARFTPAGGRVDIVLQAQPGRVRVTVRDNGKGIEPERSASIFDLPDGPRASEHLGLSLLLARACAQAHGGSLTAHSAGPGHGSEFVVELPLA